MRFIFYFTYAWAHLRRSGTWTLFAIFCVAAGVATVVSLRGLGLSITDSLLSNLRHYNHGDIHLAQVRSFGPFALAFQAGDSERQIYTADSLSRAQEYVARLGGQMTAYTLASNIQITPLGAEQAGRPQFLTTLFIDPPSFSDMTDVVLLDPPNTPLHSVFTGGLDVVISQNLADTHDLKVGDLVSVTGSDQPFIVRGIAPTDAEANIENLFASFFGFAYFERGTLTMLGLNADANTVTVNLPDGAGAEAIENAATQLGDLIGYREMNTTPALYQRNQEIADLVARFIVAMGLGALLIGGVGIMNTMLVLVRRRTLEIASLKTFGMKGKHIAALFAAEAFLLGLAGSALGAVIGVLMGGAVNSFGEAFLQQKLLFKIYPEAISYGFILGMVITGIFGVLPVLTAVKIRPAIILRPNETQFVAVGCLQSGLALLIVVVVLGLIVGEIITPIVAHAPRMLAILRDIPAIIGIAGVAAVIVLLMILTGLFWLVVWLLGHVPSFGSVDVHLALRNLSAQRTRTAMTLLALTAGMFALSSISYFGMGAREVVRMQFGQTLGGNVMIMPLVGKTLSQPVIDALLALQSGVRYKTVMGVSVASMISVNGANLPFRVPLTIMARDSNNPALSSGPLLAGRDLTPEDRGQAVVVLSAQSMLETMMQMRRSLGDNPPDLSLAGLGITVGSQIRVHNNGRVQTLTVIGIVGSPNGLAPNIAGAYIPPDVPATEVDYQVTIADVAPENADAVLRGFARIPLLLSFDLTFVDSLLSRIITQMAAIPTIVGLLSLFAAAVIMANTVSLAVLERRRQIGVLKAMGMKRGRALRVLLVENVLVGLLGGLLGVGVSGLLVNVLARIGLGVPLPVPAEAALVTVALVLASVLIAFLATFLSARLAVRETALNVLRYE